MLMRVYPRRPLSPVVPNVGQSARVSSRVEFHRVVNYECETSTFAAVTALLDHLISVRFQGRLGIWVCLWDSCSFDVVFRHEFDDAVQFRSSRSIGVELQWSEFLIFLMARLRLVTVYLIGLLPLKSCCVRSPTMDMRRN